ncbi:hypothetical protein JQ557_13730 [Bradyrhizobium sp. U87765 SZCCT0131]|uniref:hypothetical protein n=1 Tax=unclassified Bradyrhizobium TaxID=2631580 RepID=UPI001BAB4283|nr:MULTISPECIES: hypothetical protein [unclassified Bradyrhizobium]MBR1219059.1 hypothetical protein [Bradyrhizobium sp. U87765 SZCCT0131]MBR1261710.1 hypothetical protein [Bradyrhizobium sp. U87765 SZCCT0134]MBR1306437.1 hypothetical protein [Bradyrhizobium sp. U87765 SZCCT0110]MBR1317492.1 hypothetical protein [Bradyrhizobium sp. U87765 SZCCT0109]MBR1351194.1 hypothetical protein [Bradyrhizobium sp. U87765 SZCCT0048]
MDDAELQKIAADNENLILNAENPGEALRAILRSADVVYGVYPAQGGCAKLLIKGQGLLDGKHVPRKLTAVPCRSAEEARTLQATFGDGGARR